MAPLAVGIMQPYLLPYIGYFGLLRNVDTFVVFDSVQYIQRGWVNRNRLPTPNGSDWFYINVPVQKAPRETLIRDIRIAYDGKWQDKLKRSIEQQYAKAPHYAEVAGLLSPLWEKHEFLIDPLEQTLRGVAAHLGMTPTFVRSSSLVRPELSALAGESLILGICSALGATDYWNLPGGTELYQPETFAAASMNLHFVRALELEKWRPRYPALNDFSVIDVLMRVSATEARTMLDEMFVGGA